MKNSAIREMFQGKRGNFEKIKLSEDFKKLFTDPVNIENNLRYKLPSELLTEYKELIDSFQELHMQEIEEFYAEGFSFGLLMGFELKMTE